MACYQITADRDVLEVSGSSHTGTDCTATWTGVLSEKDILRFGLRSRSHVCVACIGMSHPIVDFKVDTSLLQEELDALMLSVSDFLYAGTVFFFQLKGHLILTKQIVNTSAKLKDWKGRGHCRNKYHGV
jgi:hypothetical protein